jgi:hypothetical protein
MDPMASPPEVELYVAKLRTPERIVFVLVPEELKDKKPDELDPKDFDLDQLKAGMMPVYRGRAGP